MLRLVAAGACVLASADAFAPSGGLQMPARANALAASRSTGTSRTGLLSLRAEAETEVDPNTILGKFSRMIKNRDLDHLRDGNLRYIPAPPALVPELLCDSDIPEEPGFPRRNSDGCPCAAPPPAAPKSSVTSATYHSHDIPPPSAASAASREHPKVFGNPRTLM